MRENLRFFKHLLSNIHSINRKNMQKITVLLLTLDCPIYHLNIPMQLYLNTFFFLIMIFYSLELISKFVLHSLYDCLRRNAVFGRMEQAQNWPHPNPLRCSSEDDVCRTILMNRLQIIQLYYIYRHVHQEIKIVVLSVIAASYYIIFK